ncbi:MAG: sugar MFS transporter [Sedimentisphaerales bacterium]|nr:sugar MFS transporter [Sedimentisphaerales bacterium]
MDTKPSNPRFAFRVVTVLFFMWGFITCMNDLLIPKFKADFALSQFQANLVQFAFFGAYFVVSLLYFLISAATGDPINKIGYKNGLVLGLIVAGIGCFMFYPAAEITNYPLFLGALLILGGGITIIQIAANPYVSILGPEESAPLRLNLSQGLNSLGYVVAPLIGGLLLFGKGVYAETGGIEAVKKPYIGLAVVFMLLAIAFKMIKLPEFTNPDKVTPGIKAFRHPHFVWGWLAIFFYVGSEVTVGSILINYLGDKEIMGFAAHEADKYLAFYWGGLMIGRLMGAVSLSSLAHHKKYGLMVLAAVLATVVIFINATCKHRLTSGQFLNVMDIAPYLALVAGSFIFFVLGRSNAGRMVGLFAIVATILTSLSMGSGGKFALWSIIGIGLFNSIMWSNVFTLSIRGLGKDTSQGSSLLVMMIVGGAIMPAVQGVLMDEYGVRASLGIVLVGYLYLVFFGFIGANIGRKHQSQTAIN